MSQQYKYTGIIHQIGKVQTFPSGFTKRTLVVCEDPDAKWLNFAAFDFTKDKVSELDRFKAGQKVTVSFYVNASESKKQPGSWFSGNNAVKIEYDGQNVADLIPDSSPAKVGSPEPVHADDLPF